MSTYKIIVCCDGLVAWPPDEERVIETPRVLSMLLGESESQWGRAPEVNEDGSYIFAQKWGVPCVEMARIVSYMRTGIVPSTEKELDKLKNAFARFAGCNTLDEYLHARDELEDDETPEPYNPRFPEEDYKNEYEWFVGGMAWDRDQDYVLVAHVNNSGSTYGVFRRPQTN